MEETRKSTRRPRAASTTPSGVKPAAPRTSPRPKKTATAGPGKPVPVARDEMVRTAAYFRAERRGFAAGYDLEDWLAAEAEVAALEGTAAAKQPRKTPARKATGKTVTGRKSSG